MNTQRGFKETPYDKLTYAITGIAMRVHRELGPGLREDSYQRALETAFTQAGIPFASQVKIAIYDHDQPESLLGYYIPDFIVAEKVIVEIKALLGIDNSHIAQVIGYLAVTDCPVGLLINFGTRSLQHKRIFPPPDVLEHQVNRQWLFVPKSFNRE